MTTGKQTVNWDISSINSVPMTEKAAPAPRMDVPVESGELFKLEGQRFIVHPAKDKRPGFLIDGQWLCMYAYRKFRAVELPVSFPVTV